MRSQARYIQDMRSKHTNADAIHIKTVIAEVAHS